MLNSLIHGAMIPVSIHGNNMTPKKKEIEKKKIMRWFLLKQITAQ